MVLEEFSWSDASPDVIDFVLNQAEKHLQAQFSTATAADSRAVTAASILVGLAGVAVAGVASSAQITPEAGWAIMAGATAMFCGSALCFMAARPVDFYVPGNQPEQWRACSLESLVVSKGKEIENYQSMIDDNATSLECASAFLVHGLKLALAAPIIGAAVFVLTSLIS